MPFIVDPFTTRLARGDTGSIADTWGLNVNLASPPPAALAAPYAQLLERLAAAGVTGERSGAYAYPFHTLHITCASPAPFTNTALEPHEREPFMRAWAAALTAIVSADADFPRAPVTLVYERITLEPAAAIFHVADPSNAVARLRALIARAAASLVGLPDGVAARSACRIPGIVHTTFLRFSAAPALPDDALRAAFASVASAWQPVPVVVDALRLVEECAIYMHLDIAGEDRHRILLELPFNGA